MSVIAAAAREAYSPEVDPALATVVTGGALDAKQFPPLAWSVPGVIPEGFGLLVGAPKLGKSWLALHLGLAVATGTAALGAVQTGPARPVLYLALEDGERRLQGRCRALLGEGEPIPDNLHVVTRLPEAVSAPQVITAWLALHGRRRPLVLLDTLGKVMPPAVPGEGAYARDYRIGGSLKRLSDDHPGTTLLVVHHNRKAESADWMDATSGTQGLNGSADFTLTLTRARNSEDGVLRVTGRDVAEGEYALVARGGTWSLHGDSLADAARAAETATATEALGDRAAAVVRYVADHPEGVRATDVAEALGLPDAARYLQRLHDGGRLARPKRGVYAPLSKVSGASEQGYNRRSQPYGNRTLAAGVSEPGASEPGGGHTQPDTSDALDTPQAGHAATPCTACGTALDPALAAAGETTHAACGGGLW